MQIILGAIIGLLVLSFLVAIHEAGHALVALRNKVVVEQYAIGFPPKIWSKKLKNGIEFMINAVPIGGYVKLQGEHDAADKPGDYGNVKLWPKTKILFAGVFVNFMFAALVLTILAWTGLPKVLNNQFMIKSDAKVITTPVVAGMVIEDSPAAQAGIKNGDVLLSINDQLINEASQVRQLTKKYKGQTVSIKYDRNPTDGQTSEAKIKLNAKADEKGYLGVAAGQSSFIKTTWSAPIVGVGTTVQLAGETVKGLGMMVKNLVVGLYQKIVGDQATKQAGSEKLAQVNASVAGPVGILFNIFPNLLSADLTIFAFFVAIISLTLAVMNTLPIPALDGGRWFVTVLFRLFKKPLTKDLEQKIHGTGMMFLLLLMLILVISDVAKIF